MNREPEIIESGTKCWVKYDGQTCEGYVLQDRGAPTVEVSFECDGKYEILWILRERITPFEDTEVRTNLISTNERLADSYDYVNPSHYQNGGAMETIEMMEAIWGVDALIAHCQMCAFKYRTRLGKKPNQPPLRDLEKAQWYESKAFELISKKAQ